MVFVTRKDPNPKGKKPAHLALGDLGERVLASGLF